MKRTPSSESNGKKRHKFQSRTITPIKNGLGTSRQLQFQVSDKSNDSKAAQIASWQKMTGAKFDLSARPVVVSRKRFSSAKSCSSVSWSDINVNEESKSGSPAPSDASDPEFVDSSPFSQQSTVANSPTPTEFSNSHFGAGNNEVSTFFSSGFAESVDDDMTKEGIASEESSPEGRRVVQVDNVYDSLSLRNFIREKKLCVQKQFRASPISVAVELFNSFFANGRDCVNNDMMVNCVAYQTMDVQNGCEILKAFATALSCTVVILQVSELKNESPIEKIVLIDDQDVDEIEWIPNGMWANLFSGASNLSPIAVTTSSTWERCKQENFIDNEELFLILGLDPTIASANTTRHFSDADVQKLAVKFGVFEPAGMIYFQENQQLVNTYRTCSSGCSLPLISHLLHPDLREQLPAVAAIYRTLQERGCFRVSYSPSSKAFKVYAKGMNPRVGRIHTWEAYTLGELSFVVWKALQDSWQLLLSKHKITTPFPELVSLAIEAGDAAVIANADIQRVGDLFCCYAMDGSTLVANRSINVLARCVVLMKGTRWGDEVSRKLRDDTKQRMKRHIEIGFATERQMYFAETQKLPKQRVWGSTQERVIAEVWRRFHETWRGYFVRSPPMQSLPKLTKPLPEDERIRMMDQIAFFKHSKSDFLCVRVRGAQRCCADSKEEVVRLVWETFCTSGRLL